MPASNRSNDRALSVYPAFLFCFFDIDRFHYIALFNEWKFEIHSIEAEVS